MNLTKEQAIEAMKGGRKVRHEYFSENEWATMEGNKIVLEDGVKCWPQEFWGFKTNIGWNTGWSIIPEPFYPDRELLKFANEFSDQYKALHTGTYFSDRKKYQINYVDNMDPGNPNEGARISLVTGIIEMNKNLFSKKEFNSDTVFFFIIWCVICKLERDEITADKLAIEYYQTTGRSIKNVLLGYATIFSEVANERNKQRYEILKSLIK